MLSTSDWLVAPLLNATAEPFSVKVAVLLLPPVPVFRSSTGASLTAFTVTVNVAVLPSNAEPSVGVSEIRSAPTISPSVVPLTYTVDPSTTTPVTSSSSGEPSWPDHTNRPDASNAAVMASRPPRLVVDPIEPPVELLEPYFFEFSGDLYGQEIEVALIEFLRPEAKFDGLDALKAQIAADCEAARAVLDRVRSTRPSTG